MTAATKTCLYCAETVQEAAVRCRFCGQPLPTEVLDLSQRGRRYAVGPTTEGGLFGVWDLSAGGPPIATYPEDESGWGQAWAYFSRMEGSATGPRPGVSGMNGQAIGGAVMAGLGALVIGIGAFLPWLAATGGFVSVSSNGFDNGGDGPLVLGAAGAILVALVIMLAGRRPQSGSAVIIGLGGLAALGIAIYDGNRIQQRVQSYLGTLDSTTRGLVNAHLGSGLYVIGTGAVLAIVAALVLFGSVNRRSTTTAAAARS